MEGQNSVTKSLQQRSDSQRLAFLGATSGVQLALVTMMDSARISAVT
jgi:hypothetical protein